MSASFAEVQPLADAILELLSVRLTAGQLVIHFSEGRVQKCEVNSVHHQSRHPRRGPEPLLDSSGNGAQDRGTNIKR